MKKILLIFGANGDLGTGASNVLTSKNYDKVYLLSTKETSRKNGKIEYIQTNDLSIEKNVMKVFEKIAAEKDAVYYLFSTIGGFWGGKNVDETDLKDFEKMFSLNVNISFLIAKHFSKFVSRVAGGSICFTSAMTSLSPEQNKVAYGLSKNGLNYLVKSLAKEGKKNNLSANAIAPLVLDTSENREWVKDSSIMVSPEAIGELINSIFENSKIVSGNIIELPGTIKMQ